MIAARPTLDRLLELYLHAKPDQRQGSKDQLRLSVSMLEFWAKRELFCDELCESLLLDFRAWRIAKRPLPACPKHNAAMYCSSGTTFRCRQRGCTERASHAKTASAPTANKDVRTLHALWSHAVKIGFSAGPAVAIKALRENLDNQEAWTPQELGKIVAACRMQDEEIEMPCSSSDFWPAFALLKYETASRVGALMRATPADLDLESGTITLRSETTKGHKCHVYGLTPETLAEVKKIYDPTGAYLLPWPYGRTNNDWRALRTRWKKILAMAGVKPSKNPFHKMRRTSLTQIAKLAGLAAAKEHAGHSHESVTQRYIDRRQLDEVRRNASLLPRPTL